ISEAFDRAGQEAFGFDRVDRVVREHAVRGADDLVTALSAAVAGWSGGEPHDDETLLVVARPARTSGASRKPGGRDPMEHLAEAESRGAPLQLAANLESLAALGPWLARAPDLAELDSAERRQLEVALYEACANVAEHGLQLDAAQSFDL